MMIGTLDRLRGRGENFYKKKGEAEGGDGSLLEAKQYLLGGNHLVLTISHLRFSIFFAVIPCFLPIFGFFFLRLNVLRLFPISVYLVSVSPICVA